MAGEYLREAYPLMWPEHQPRTQPGSRRHAKFEMDFGRARDELVRELKLLSAQDIVISSNVPLRRDGLPLADAREPVDPGVAVYFDRHRTIRRAGTWETLKTPFVIACDTYSRVKWNLRAVGATVEALRAIERHGSTSMLEQAFTGFAALPAHVTADPPWWETLGVSADATPAQVRARFHELAQRHHPDHGGEANVMAQINRAVDAALGVGTAGASR